MVKNPTDNAEDIRDAGSTPELGRSPKGGHGHPLQYSCLENSMDRRAWKGCKELDRVTELDTAEATQHTCMHV